MARYVATSTTDNNERQTFVFEGTATLDDVFEHVACRDRQNTMKSALDHLTGTFKVFSLTISRDESVEPEKKSMAELLGQETPQQQ